MYLLSNFARTYGAKDKSARKKKLLRVAGSIVATGLLATALVKNKNKLVKLTTKSSNKVDNLKSPVSYKNQSSYQKKSSNSNLVKSRRDMINKELGLTMYPDKKSLKEAKKAAVTKLKKENKYFKSSSNLLSL